MAMRSSCEVGEIIRRFSDETVLCLLSTDPTSFLLSPEINQKGKKLTETTVIYRLRGISEPIERDDECNIHFSLSSTV